MQLEMSMVSRRHAGHACHHPQQNAEHVGATHVRMQYIDAAIAHDLGDSAQFGPTAMHDRANSLDRQSIESIP
jgi:hypothetical protein